MLLPAAPTNRLKTGKLKIKAAAAYAEVSHHAAHVLLLPG